MTREPQTSQLLEGRDAFERRSSYLAKSPSSEEVLNDSAKLHASSEKNDARSCFVLNTIAIVGGALFRKSQLSSKITANFLTMQPPARVADAIARIYTGDAEINRDDGQTSVSRFADLRSLAS